MPAGIGQSVANPAALTRPQANGQRETQAPVESSQAAQTPLAAEQDQVVRAPEANTGSQGVQNQPSGAGPGGSTSAASAPEPTPQPRQLEVERGLGGNVDVTA